MHPFPTKSTLTPLLRRLTVALLLCCLTWAASSQTIVPSISTGQPLQLAASQVNGQRFDIRALENKVTVAFFWNTDCAVCRDSLPELRANLAGWKHKPFGLLLVNVDRKVDDWRTYEALMDTTLTNAANMLSVRLEGQLAPGTRLPLTLLIDRNGRVLKRFEGRLAPEVWDGVADVLP